ncbi:MAG TPA: HAMP domain-containing sensor histidine kinase [Gaiellaceae bacterium]|jgi:signal transduction histidine kinase|nr:HAMP domain-containing sensor histidine kinase [Gaiellaceae bacterium]
MLGSLRVRLPLVFLAGIVLAGLITTLISVRLFQDFSRAQTLTKLKREGHGIAQLYSDAVAASYGNVDKKTGKSNDRKPPTFDAPNLEKATGNKIYFTGPGLFPGQGFKGLEKLPRGMVNWISGKSLTFEFTPPHASGTYLAVANPIIFNPGSKDETTIGAIIVATKKTDVNALVSPLIARLAIAGALGLLVAAMLSWYLSRRIVRPVLQLSDAVDAIASGQYDVTVPAAPGELGHLSARIGEMAHRLGEVEEMERNFLMSVSHELRTPLTAIRGHVSALLDEGVVVDPESRNQSLETVEAEAQRLERLVGDILDLAKLDTHRFTVLTEEVDMAQLLDQAFERYLEEAERRSIDYRQEVRDRPVITSDGDRVLQVVGNLLSNAFKATPNGGKISLELARQNGTVHVAVEDTGPGIPAEARERLFRPFVSGSAGGTGLGLAIAKEISTALGGRIILESEVGKGSRFELVLPADDES